MKQPIMNRRYSRVSLSGHGSVPTVPLRMAEDQGRAKRIVELKKRHPLLTWAIIASRVGVQERSTYGWRNTGAIKPENAAALAEVFGVDFDYIWTGPRPDTPEVFVERRGQMAEVAERLARIEETLARIEEAVSIDRLDAAIRAAIEAEQPHEEHRVAARPGTREQ